MTHMSKTLSKREYAALPEGLREALRLENLHDVLVGTSTRKRVIATSKDVKPVSKTTPKRKRRAV